MSASFVTCNDLQLNVLCNIFRIRMISGIQVAIDTSWIPRFLVSNSNKLFVDPTAIILLLSRFLCMIMVFCAPRQLFLFLCDGSMKVESKGPIDITSSLEKIKKQLNSCRAGNVLLQGPLLKRSEIVSSSSCWEARDYFYASPAIMLIGNS